MTQEVKALATKPDNLHSILKTHIVERNKESMPSGCSLTSTCVLYVACIHTYTQRIIVIKKLIPHIKNLLNRVISCLSHAENKNCFNLESHAMGHKRDSCTHSSFMVLTLYCVLSYFATCVHPVYRATGHAAFFFLYIPWHEC